VYQTLFERGVISTRVPSRKQIYMYIWNTIYIFLRQCMNSNLRKLSV